MADEFNTLYAKLKPVIWSLLERGYSTENILESAALRKAYQGNPRGSQVVVDVINAVQKDYVLSGGVLGKKATKTTTPGGQGATGSKAVPPWETEKKEDISTPEKATEVLRKRLLHLYYTNKIGMATVDYIMDTWQRLLDEGYPMEIIPLYQMLTPEADPEQLTKLAVDTYKSGLAVAEEETRWATGLTAAQMWSTINQGKLGTPIIDPQTGRLMGYTPMTPERQAADEIDRQAYATAMWTATRQRELAQKAKEWEAELAGLPVSEHTRRLAAYAGYPKDLMPPFNPQDSVKKFQELLERMPETQAAYWASRADEIIPEINEARFKWWETLYQQRLAGAIASKEYAYSQGRIGELEQTIERLTQEAQQPIPPSPTPDYMMEHIIQQGGYVPEAEMSEAEKAALAREGQLAQAQQELQQWKGTAGSLAEQIENYASAPMPKDPLEEYLRKYPFQQRFLQLSPRRRGFYSGITAPPAVWR